MNAYMNISVRVLSASAQAQIKALQAQVAGLQRQLAATNAAGSSGSLLGGSSSRKSLAQFGSTLQATGRQLQYNFTLPILLAAGAATKFALDNEKAFTRIQKVYGDSDDATQYYTKNTAKLNAVLGDTANAEQYANVMKEHPGITREAAAAQVVFANETDALGRSMEAMSNKYGVAQAEVLETGSAWAAAGVSGAALAKSTDLSIRAAVLGDLDLAKATESLIAIQGQYQLSTGELNLTLAELNAIENQTGISMAGLIDGFARAAGTAREYGVDVRHLGAMMASLVPATGSAASAGNSLKTIMSRLLNPTQAASEVMAAFGINTADASWKSSTAMDRLQAVADKMNGTLRKTGDATKDVADDGYALSDSQKAVVASTLGSNYQVNRFLVLMRELGPEHTNYEKALNATADKTKVFATAQYELDKVLKSSPQRLKIIWTMLQNGMADAIQPMIPYLLYLADAVGHAVRAFADMDPTIQKMIISFILLIAVLAPLMRLFGAIVKVATMIAKPFQILISVLGSVGGAFMGLFTSTTMVEGAAIRTTRAWFRFLNPFRIVSDLISVVGGKLLATVGGFSVWAGGVNKVRAAMGTASAFISLYWEEMMRVLSLRNLAPKFLAVLGSLAAGIVGVFSTQLTWAALSNRAMAAWAIAQQGITAVWAAAMVMLARGMEIARLGVAAGGASARIALERAYASASLVVTAAWSRGIMAIQAGLWRAIAVVSVSGSAALRGIWLAMLGAKTAMTAAFWGRIKALYLLGFVALKKIALQGMRFLLGPWGLLIITVLQIMYHFREQIAQVWNNIISYFSDNSNAMVSGVVSAFNQLPAGVSNALVAVANIVKRAALAIYGWFSYINPFAHHSPSLVENVTSGTSVVGDQFVGMADTIGGATQDAHRDVSAFSSRIVDAGTKAKSAFGSLGAKIARDLKSATGAIKAFQESSKGLVANAAQAQVKKDRKQVKKFAPGSLDEFDRLQGVLKSLNSDLDRMDGRVKQQQAVVDRWTEKLKNANEALDKQQDKLDRLTEKQQKWQDAYDEASDRLEEFASAPLVGMRAMSDAIFENDMAQKRLRLEMMKMEEVGGTFENIKSKIDEMNGAIELLRGEQADLRNAGAGSEILSQYDDQIKALEDQKKALNASAAPIQAMTDQLAALSTQADRLDLENSLAFDPLTRQIEQAASAMQEMPFDQIMAGVQQARADMDTYGAALEKATAKVVAQQAVVDAATDRRDRIQKSLDAESEKLDTVKDKYDKVKDAIDGVTDALNVATQAASDMASKADEAKAKKKAAAEKLGSPALQNFKKAEGGNFADVGGKGIPIRTNFDDQSAKIDEFTKGLGDQASGALAGLNPFEPIKAAWGKFTDWFKSKFDDLAPIVKDAFGKIFSGVSFGGESAGDMVGKLKGTTDKIKEVFLSVYDFLDKWVITPAKALWNLFWPDIKDAALNAWDAIKPLLAQFQAEFESWKDLFHPFLDALAGVFDVVKVVAAWLIIKWSFIGKIITSVVANTIGPAITMIGGVILNLIQILKGVFQFVIGFFQLIHGIFTGNGDMIVDALKMMGKGIWNVVAGIFGGIGDIIWGALKIIVGAVWGVVKGVFNWFAWLYDELIGHSIIPDIINGIKFWFDKLVSLATWIYDHVLKPIFDAFVWAFGVIIAAIKLWWTAIQTEWAILATLGQWFWDFVLKPIWDVFVWLWDNAIKPALSAWWENMKATWSALLTAGQWFVDNVLTPVWDAFVWVWDRVKDGLDQWWTWIKAAWNAIKAAGEWMKTNVLQPVLNAFGWVWTQVKAGLEQWWAWIQLAWAGIKTAGEWLKTNVLDRVTGAFSAAWTTVKAGLDQWWTWIKTAWDGLKTAADWVKTNVMDPVKTAFENGWNKVSEFFTKNAGMILSPIKSVVRGIIDLLNLMIRGINQLDKLPGVEVNVSEITKPDWLAAGGTISQRRVGNGFKTAGARAIVGEGKANYPEYVIPTDPTYRNRARGLLQQAGSKLGVETVPMHAAGGVLGDITDTVKNVGGKAWDKLKDLGRDAISSAMSPVFDGARKAVGALPDWTVADHNIPHEAANGGIDLVQKYVNQTQAAYAKEYDEAKEKAAKAAALAGGGNVAVIPGSGNRVSWKGGTFTDNFVKHMQKAEQLAGAGVNVIQGGFRPATSYSGTSHQGDAVDMSVNYALLNAFRRVGIAAGDRTGLGNWSPHIHAVPGPSAGSTAGSATWQWSDYVARGGMSQSATSPWGLKEGGIALASRGPSLQAIGDGRYDEAVVPLPKGWRSNGSLVNGGNTDTKTVNFYGDLSFPNITSPDDAEAFLENLQNLVKD